MCHHYLLTVSLSVALSVERGAAGGDDAQLAGSVTAAAKELAEAVTILENALKIAKRVLGPEHPQTCCICGELVLARETLRVVRGIGRA